MLNNDVLGYNKALVSKTLDIRKRVKHKSIVMALRIVERAEKLTEEESKQLVCSVLLELQKKEKSPEQVLVCV
jgi:hypothetical protein